MVGSELTIFSNINWRIYQYHIGGLLYTYEDLLESPQNPNFSVLFVLHFSNAFAMEVGYILSNLHNIILIFPFNQYGQISLIIIQQNVVLTNIMTF